MKVNFFNESNTKVREYEKIIKNVFKTIGGKKEFNLIFVNQDEIKRINKEYRKLDKVTDVISFANCDDPTWDKKNKELGDIFICIERAEEQAKEYGHSVRREFAFLAVHGYLHLCGFDHMKPEEEKVMFKIQDDILLKAGIKR